MCKAAFCKPYFTMARIIFYKPSFKWEEGQWQPADLVYKGTGTHWCNAASQVLLHSAISPDNPEEKSKTARASPPLLLSALPTQRQTSCHN